MSALPQKYSIIYADPPWHYNSRRYTGARFGQGVHAHYPTMSTEEICTLPVQEICDESSVLFLWATWPRLPAAMQVIEAWGFEYKTIGFLWVKLNPARFMEDRMILAQRLLAKGTARFLEWLAFFGVGFYAKSNTEPCLLAAKGDTLHPITNKVSSLVFAPRGKHSAKPPAVRKRIVKLMGDLPRIELFAREATPGWFVLGNEVESTASLEAVNA